MLRPRPAVRRRGVQQRRHGLVVLRAVVAGRVAVGQRHGRGHRVVRVVGSGRRVVGQLVAVRQVGADAAPATGERWLALAALAALADRRLAKRWGIPVRGGQNNS